MRGDFSRWTFNPAHAYSRVLLQQGRVLLDADWNEQAAIHLHLLRQLAGDLIGPHGGPATGCGFEITRPSADNSPDLLISSGRYYVDGLMCELAPWTDADKLRYSAQPFMLPGLQAADLMKEPLLVYLDVWEQMITELEDTDILDPALGGVDTCVRADVMWQVRVQALEKFSEEVTTALKKNPKRIDDTVLPHFRADLLGSSRGQLKVRARQPEDTTDACLSPPDNRYRGMENQLYRVEIHQGGTAQDGTAEQATFKWSRENGSVAFAADLQGNTLEVSGVRDTVHGLRAGDWIELTSPGLDWMAQPGEMVLLARVDGNHLTTDGPITSPVLDNQGGPLLVRRWDQVERENAPLSGGAVPIQEGTGQDGWIELEDGIQIQFQSGDHHYQSGDYWTVPARTATGDVQWPQLSPGSPGPLPPMGVDHHYAPLALLSEGKVADLRKKFSGLAR